MTSIRAALPARVLLRAVVVALGIVLLGPLAPVASASITGAVPPGAEAVAAADVPDADGALLSFLAADDAAAAGAVPDVDRPTDPTPVTAPADLVAVDLGDVDADSAGAVLCLVVAGGLAHAFYVRRRGRRHGASAA